MNKLFRLLLISVICLTSCNNQQSRKTIVDLKAELEKLNDFLKKYEQPSQTFVVTTEKPTQVKGHQGTIISINPADLSTESGQSLGINIEIELKELTNQEQLLRANAQTVSNGQLLVSGGAYYINMTSDGQQLKLKEGKTLKVEIPKLTDTDMSLFYGQRDSLGRMNWELDNEVIANKITIKDTIYSETSELFFSIEGDSSNRAYSQEELNRILTEKDYYKNLKAINYVMSIRKFGWINCDRFLDNPNITNLPLAFNQKEQFICANVFLVFEDINSIMQVAYCSSDDSKEFKNIPIGAKTKLIAYSIKDGKVFSFKTNLTIETGKTIDLTLNETPENEIEKLFSLK